MTRKEAVLCIDRKNLPESWVAPESIIRMDMETFCTTCTSAGFSFRPRDGVETDPGFKQIIPYILFQTHDFIETAIYRRAGGEKRLHDLWSVGIGGHINPEDHMNGDQSFPEILTAGMDRELTEEISLRPSGENPEFIGMINEEITDVGRVHLGAVFRIITRFPRKIFPGPELADFSWEKTAEVNRKNLELWSRLALKLVL